MTVFAMSSGLPNLSNGILDFKMSLYSSLILSVISVDIKPGDIQLTQIFFSHIPMLSF